MHLLAFNYGQRHKKELQFASMCARRLNAEFSLIDLSSVGALLGGSALTDQSIEVPEGHYEAPNMALTVVPNRNAIMLSIAYGVAVAEGADKIGIAVHAGDHAVYPDCRPDFINLMTAMERVATEGFSVPGLAVYAPFINYSKAKIVEIGTRFEVPFGDTWSCYKGERFHCGKCGTCVERHEAFELAGVTDPTVYA